MRSPDLCFAIVLVAITGCRQIVGFDETPPEPADGAPFLPFVPAPQYLDACTSCAADKCMTEHQACLDDASCKAMLRCRGACSNPVCIARCGSFDLIDYADSRDAIAGRRGAENANFADYHRCVSWYGCRAECGAGLNWDCTARYPWPNYPEHNPLSLQLELLDEVGNGASASVTAYIGQGAITQPAHTAGWGQTELKIPSSASGPAFLQVESDPDALDELRMLDYSGPFFRDTRLSRTVFPVGHPIFPQSGFAGVLVVATDCLGFTASGITFELDGTSSRADYNFGDVSNVENTNKTGMGLFKDVSANGTITVRARKDEVIVAQQRVELRENWLTSVVLRPLTEDD
jgi:hypothetical protein